MATNTNNDLNQPIKDLLTKSNNIFVLLSQNPSPDTLTAGLGLYQALKQTDKNVVIACPTKLDTQNVKLPGIDQITDKIGNQNLVISLKVNSRDSIDKVSYNLDEDSQVFNLIIQPRKGQAPLKSDDVNYSYSGARADIIFIVGANRFEDLGFFYQDERKLFTDSKTVAINRLNTNYATYNLNNGVVSSMSEQVYGLAVDLGFKLNANIATNLLAGIDTITNNLQNASVSPNTFDVVAALLRLGGTRRSYQAPTTSTTSTAGTNQLSSAMQTAKPAPVSAPQTTPVPAATPQSQQPIATPTPAQTPSPKPQNGGGDKKDVPQDWLSPKIYKGSGSGSGVGRQ